MKEMTLIIWKDNWADEMDVESWQIVEGNADEIKASWASFCQRSIEDDGFLEHYIGTNEMILYVFAEALMATLFIPVTEKQAEFLVGTFGNRRAISMP